MLKNENAKTAAAIEDDAHNKQNHKNNQDDIESENITDCAKEPNNELGRKYDFSGCTLEYTTLNLFGNEIKRTTSFEGLERIKTNFGLVNLKTAEGNKLFYFDVSEKIDSNFSRKTNIFLK